MQPSVALIVTLGFILWLVVQDSRRSRGTTRALWIPLCWFVIINSRFVSVWLNLGIPMHSPTALEEGSPIDAAVFFFLMLVALWTLLTRSVSWGSLPWVNLGLFVYLAYGALSIGWSDFPFVAFKRWVKVLGHPLMVLVVLSEPDPKAAIRALFRRSAYILVPLSIVFIKYYPHLGRGFSAWTGEGFNTGVTTNKNALGILCLIAGFVFVWDVFVKRSELVEAVRRRDVRIGILFLLMILWLLNKADSATALGALVIGITTLVALRLRKIREGRLGLVIVTTVALLFVLDFTFDLWSVAITALGRDATLTDRTLLWDDVLALQVNPLLGAGFESFWLGDRAATLWQKWSFRPNQAHNGYLETYMTGGWVGLACLVGLIISSYRKAKARLNEGQSEGRLRMGLLAILLVYNYTEASFKAMHPMFFIAFFLALELPRSVESVAVNRSGALGREERGISRSGSLSTTPSRNVGAESHRFKLRSRARNSGLSKSNAGRRH